MTTDRTEPTDTDLVARARAGDGAAFGALVGRHQQAALRLAAAICGSTADAADTIGFSPPLVITESEIDTIVEVARAATDQVADELRREN